MSLTDEEKLVLDATFQKMLTTAGGLPHGLPFNLSDLTSSGGSSSSTAGSTTGAIVLAVSSSGSDVNNALRTPTLTTGNLSSLPFLTLQAAIASLPQNIKHRVIVNMAAGTFAGATISGLSGGAASLQVVGTWALSTLSAGLNAGTAGAGTTGTSLVKPTAAANWTNANLVGKYLVVDSGGGASGDPLLPTVRLITANNTTTATVSNIPGLDNTSVFRICDSGTSIRELIDNALIITGNRCPIVIRDVKFANNGALNNMINSSGNAAVNYSNLGLIVNSAGQSILSNKDDDVYIGQIYQNANQGVTVSYCSKYAEVFGVYSFNAGAVTILDCMAGKTWGIQSASSPSYVLSIKNSNFFQAEVLASGGATVPVYLENVNHFEAIGTNKLSGSTNTGYGVEIQKAGTYDLAGSTITGSSGDVSIAGTNFSWANLNSGTYGSATSSGMSIIVNPAGTKVLVDKNQLFLGSLDISGRALLFGYLNTSANTVVPSIGAGQTLDMEAGTINGVDGGFGAVRGALSVNSTNSGSICLLPTNAAIAGVFVIVMNVGAAATTVKAPNGKNLNGGTSGVVVGAGTAKMFVSLNTNGGQDYFTMS